MKKHGSYCCISAAFKMISKFKFCTRLHCFLYTFNRCSRNEIEKHFGMVIWYGLKKYFKISLNNSLNIKSVI